MKKLLLIDGDVIAYQSAASSETVVQWTEYLWSLWCNPQDAIGRAVQNIENLIDTLQADRVIICLSDSHNFRKDINPSYKSNRANNRRPMALEKVKEYLEENYECFKRPGMEADDVMGVLSTWANFKPDYQKIVVSIDKDMQTFPGYLYNPSKHQEVQYIDPVDADLYFYSQCLAGDPVDGYGGCPNVGMQTALDMLMSGSMWASYEHTFKTGRRKGLTETKWHKVESPSYWDTVLSCFKKAGLGEEYAIVQAQMARICRFEDYDFKEKKVIPWHPSNAV